MRIIAGKNKGTKLYTLEGNEITRPTLDRVKEPLFSILMPFLENAEVLDLFSGSGALALEAISRGAKHSVLVDNSFKAISVIKQNIEKTNMQETTTIIKNDFKKAIDYLANSNSKFDIIFIDPPYESDYIKESLELITKNKILKSDGIIVAETDRKEEIIEQLKIDYVEINDVRKYGRINLIFLKIKQ